METVDLALNGMNNMRGSSHQAHYVCLKHKVYCVKLQQQLGCAVPGRSSSPTSAAPYLRSSSSRPLNRVKFSADSHQTLQVSYCKMILVAGCHSSFPDIINKCTTTYLAFMLFPSILYSFLIVVYSLLNHSG